MENVLLKTVQTMDVCDIPRERELSVKLFKKKIMKKQPLGVYDRNSFL